MICLGLDTSNYTTSAAWYDGTAGVNAGRLLEVKSGQLGLRQSEALFQHVKRLPEIMEGLEFPEGGVSAVGASTRPRAVEGSYMPCFLAGESQGRSLARVLDVPFYGFSHQQGHIAAVLYSAERLSMMDKPMLAWHLSGGTTELLYVEHGLRARKIGGTEDLSAGQLIDRTGQLLGLDFPAGKALDALGARGKAKGFSIRVQESRFSLSGMENQVQAKLKAETPQEEIAAFALASVCTAVKRATEQALLRYGNLPVIFTGGVSSNSMLRTVMEPVGGIFGSPRYSTDNAMGIAVLTDLAKSRNLEIQNG